MTAEPPADAVLVSATQNVFTLDHGGVPASRLLAIGHFTVLSYDRGLCRYAAVGAHAEAAGQHHALDVVADGGHVSLITGQPLLLGDGTEGNSSGLAPGVRLFGVTVDRDEDGDVRVHLRDGLKGKSKLDQLGQLPATAQADARTPAGIKSDRAVESVSDAARVAAVAVILDGPSNLIVWPDAAPVGLGILVGA